MIDPAIRAIEIQSDLAALERTKSKLLQAVNLLDGHAILTVNGSQQVRDGIEAWADENYLEITK